MSSNNTLSERRDIVVPRIVFIVLCGVGVLLLVAVLVLWFKYPGRPPHVSELDTALAAEKTAFVALVSLEGEFSLFDPDKGRPIAACGRNRGDRRTGIPEGCELKGKIKDLRNIGVLSVIVYEGSDCQLVTDGSNTYDVHYRRPYRGGNPCHHPH